MPRYKIKTTHKKTGQTRLSFETFETEQQAAARIRLFNALTGHIHKHLTEYTREVIKIK